MMLPHRTIFRFALVKLRAFCGVSNFSVSAPNIPTEQGNSTIELKATKSRGISHKTKLNDYFESCEKRLSVKQFLPDELSKKKKVPDSLYLVDPTIAHIIASHIAPYIKENKESIIAECSPGIGLLTEGLLKEGVRSIRLYEAFEGFHLHLQTLTDKYPGRLQLFTKDLFKIQNQLFLDTRDDGKRAQTLLGNVPKKNWGNEPAMIIIGPNVNTLFLRHLARALPMQNSLAEYGRVELFLMLRPKDYLRLSNDDRLSIKSNSYMSILFNLIFEHEVIDMLPREAFLPWELQTKNDIKRKTIKIDEDKVYLARVAWKKDLPLPLDQLMQFYIFLKQTFSKRTKIVPVLESWVPGCGENIIWPKLNPTDYFEDINIFTEFGQLTPMQIINVFREMHAHPSYQGSPFLEMVEEEILKFESTEARTDDPLRSHLEKRIISDIEVD